MNNSKSGRDKIPNDGHLYNYLIKTKFNLTDEQAISLSKEHYKNDAETNLRLNFNTNNSWNSNKAKYKMDRDTYNIAYTYIPIDNELIDLKVSAYHTEQTSTHMKPVHGDGAGFDSIAETQGVKIRNKSVFDTKKINHNLTYGYEYFDTVARYTDPAENTYNKKVESGKSSSLYLEDDIRLGDFHVIPGVRWDHYKYETANKNDEVFDKNYSHISKAMGLKYEIGTNTTLFSNYTELFRGPLGKEIGLGRTNHSDSLKATTGYNLEAGVITAHSGIFSERDTLNLSGKAFQTNFKNLSTTLYKRSLQNIPKSRLEGFELSGAYHIDGLGLKTSYTKVKNEITKGNDKFQKGHEFEPSLGDTITVGASYLFDKTDIELGWNSRFVLDKTSQSKEKHIHKSGYGVSDFYISWSPKLGEFKNTEVLLGMDNVFDKRYNEHSYYLDSNQGQEEKGRSYKATLSYKF